jgi:CheY-like chemotaxis protein
VLLVEVDPEVRGVVGHFLASIACEVIACANGEEALRALAAQDVGLLLTDILLGAGLRGTELADAALALRPGLPVLLMSGYSGELLEEPQGRELLRKPFTRTDLEQAIARMLHVAQ